MKYLKIFFIFIAFSIFRYYFFGNVSNSPEDCQLTYQVLDRVANKITHKYQARRIGSGGGSMFEIEHLTLYFRYDETKEIPEYRKLITSFVEEFLSEINNDKKIRPYLIWYPFLPQNIELIILAYEKDHSGNFKENYDVISIRNGEIAYKIYSDKDSSDSRFVMVEKYDEAIAKMNKIRIECK